MWKVYLIILLKISSGKRLKLVIDGIILPLASAQRANRNKTLYSQHYGEKTTFEEVYYGVLVVVLCDEDRAVHDVYDYEGYKGALYVVVCVDKEKRGIRQVVEGMISVVNGFNAISRWRMLLATAFSGGLTCKVLVVYVKVLEVSSHG